MKEQKLKITVIDDNEQMSEMVKDYLSQKFEEAEITIYNSGEKALAEINQAPDVIILDYQLDIQNTKALNGIQVLMQLKKRFSTPIIFLSAQEKTEISASIIKHGAYDYVVKNQQSFHRLEVIINNILESNKLKKNVGSQKTLITALIILVVIIAAAFLLTKIF
jgi:DNA-binding response OmpR family regulator